MYQNIVIALDGSHNATLALNEAIELAKVTGARLIPVHVASLRDISVEGVGMLGSHDLHALAQTRGRDILSEAESEIRKAGLDKVETVIVESWDGGKEMARMLIDVARERGADLIVLGTHGRAGLMNLLMGSFAETLLKVATLPLLIVRNPHDDDEVKAFEKRPLL